jgi:hypothetical protein
MNFFFIHAEEPLVYYSESAFSSFGSESSDSLDISDPKIRDSFPESWIFEDFQEYVEFSISRSMAKNRSLAFRVDFLQILHLFYVVLCLG